MSKIDYNYKKMRPFKWFILENFPFLEDSIDVLNNYQLFCKLGEEINKNRDAINNIGVSTEDLVTAFNNLYDYVNEYFENLDVQDEINNKLDQMVEDGTMDILLQRVISSYDEYNFHTLFASEYYRDTDSMAGMQGGCVLPDGTIIQFTGKRGDNTGKVIHFGSDGTILNSRTVDYGHCNGVTYCDETDSVFITSTQDDTLGRYMIYEINKSTLDEISRQDLTEKNFPGEPYGLAYIKEDKSFVFINYWFFYQATKYMWKTDLDFNVTNTKQINMNFRSTSNVGRFGDYIAVNTISSYKMMLFNIYNLDLYREVSINELVSDTWFITEVEWIDTRNDKIYLGFVPASATSPQPWGGGTKIVAYFDSEINYQETGRQNSEFPPFQEIYYVDGSIPLNPLRDGSNSAPFRNIYEALNSALRTKNVTGDVTIWLKTNEVNTYKPIFSMNKSYRVYKNFDGQITCMGSLAVAEKAVVFIDGYVKFTNGSLIDVYGWGDCHIQNRGKLIINNYCADSNFEHVIIGSSGSSYTSFAVGNGGIDISKLYGDFVNMDTGTQNASVLTPIPSSTSSMLTKRVRGIQFDLVADNNGKYQIPLISPVAFVKIRVNLPNGSGSILREQTLIYTYNQYQDYVIPYIDSNNANQFLHITISATGLISITSTRNVADATNLRVRFISY